VTLILLILAIVVQTVIIVMVDDLDLDWEDGLQDP
jgi:hypothetical protein